jgi:MFS family permease
MLKEVFLGRCPSHFKINPLVKAYIASESLMWSAWNFIIPIFAVFIVNNVKGGNVELAAMGYSTYLMSRVVFELMSGKYLLKTDDRKKIMVVILGMACLSLSYLGFSIVREIHFLLFYYFVAGVGLGLAMPAKNSLFSIHLDKNREATEWSLADATQFTFMAAATAIGGFVAFNYGFQPLFIAAFLINCIAIFPYLFLLNRKAVAA